MTVKDFKQYCDIRKPSIIIYDGSNDKELTVNGGRTDHYSAIKMQLMFDSVIVEFNPNVIVFKCHSGIMYVNAVTDIQISGKCMLGDVITIYATTSNGKNAYVFIMR